MGGKAMSPEDPKPDPRWPAGAPIEKVARIVRRAVECWLEQPEDRGQAYAEILADALDSLSDPSCPDPAEGSRFDAWVARRTEWRCKDWRRRKQVRRLRLVTLEGVDEAKLAAAAAPTSLRGRDLSCISRWIDELPNELWKEEFRLRYFEGLNSEEIGRRLGRPRNTVRSDLRRARAEIRRRHRQEGQRLLEGDSLE